MKEGRMAVEKRGKEGKEREGREREGRESGKGKGRKGKGNGRRNVQISVDTLGLQTSRPMKVMKEGRKEVDEGRK